MRYSQARCMMRRERGVVSGLCQYFRLSWRALTLLTMWRQVAVPNRGGSTYSELHADTAMMTASSPLSTPNLIQG